MGFRVSNPFNRKHADAGAVTPPPDRVNRRFDEHFPRLFAYLRTCVGGEIPAQDIAVKAFSQAFRQTSESTGDDEFRTVLYRAARRMSRPALRDKHSHDDALTTREREIISLVFDAGLSRGQIAYMFHFRESTISTLLMSGLRKLKAETSPAMTAAYMNVA
jgi:DNA-directed RNA polymerase specialized sigma24 family protein